MVSTDGRTDGQTDTERYNIIPQHLSVAGYKNSIRNTIRVICFQNVCKRYQQITLGGKEGSSDFATQKAISCIVVNPLSTPLFVPK